MKGYQMKPVKTIVLALAFIACAPLTQSNDSWIKSLRINSATKLATAITLFSALHYVVIDGKYEDDATLARHKAVGYPDHGLQPYSTITKQDKKSLNRSKIGFGLGALSLGLGTITEKFSKSPHAFNDGVRGGLAVCAWMGVAVAATKLVQYYKNKNTKDSSTPTASASSSNNTSTTTEQPAAKTVTDKELQNILLVAATYQQ